MVDKSKSILTLCKQQENNVSSFNGYVHSHYKSNVQEGCFETGKYKKMQIFHSIQIIGKVNVQLTCFPFLL